MSNNVPATSTIGQGQPWANLGTQNYTVGNNPSGSIWNGYNQSSYANDFMMPKDFSTYLYDPNSSTLIPTDPQTQQNQAVQQNTLAQGTAQQTVQTNPQQQAVQQTPQQLSQQPETTQENKNPIDENQLKGFLVRDNKSNKNNLIKAGCAGTLFSLPILEGIWSAITKKGVTLSKALNLKSLAITCPILGLIGFGLSNILLNSNTTKQESLQC